MVVRDSGMKRVLRLRDGDSERCSGIKRETRTRLGGAQVKREIEHKALLPQVQALYTRATYYLVSTIKLSVIRHESRISQCITKAISQPMSHQSSVSDKGTASARRSNQE